MRVEILGCQGGVAQGYNATSFLIDDHLLLDAGTVASTLVVERQSLIDNVLITHSHLDHIKDLAFVCDNCFVQRTGNPIQVHSHKTTIDALKTHFFNDSIWPNFNAIPSQTSPLIEYNELIPETEYQVGDFKITPVLVNHPGDTLGFLIERDGKCLVFSSDTGPTERIWEIARERNDIVGIFTEVSFPNALDTVAKLSYHHTPRMIYDEYQKMPQGVPVCITHLKPAHQETIITEIQGLKLKDIQVLHHDGSVLTF